MMTIVILPIVAITKQIAWQKEYFEPYVANLEEIIIDSEQIKEIDIRDYYNNPPKADVSFVTDEYFKKIDKVIMKPIPDKQEGTPIHLKYTKLGEDEKDKINDFFSYDFIASHYGNSEYFNVELYVPKNVDLDKINDFLK